MALRNAISVLQPKWICWEEESKHLWVRDMPKDSINIHNCPLIDYMMIMINYGISI